MQERIGKIVPRLSEEKLIEELLATNDEMNTAFTRYHRLIALSINALQFTLQYVVFFGNMAILFLTAASRFERRLTNGPEAAQKVETTAHILIKLLFPSQMLTFFM